MPADRDTPDATPEAILRALPVGVAVFDAEQRLMLANPAFCAAVSLPPETTEQELALPDLSLVHAPSNPAEDVRADVRLAPLHGDPARPQHRRERHANGRIYDLLSTPLPQGGHVRCTVEVTPSLWDQPPEPGRPLARASTAQEVDGTSATLPAAFAAGDKSQHRTAILDSILAFIPHGICVYGPDRRLTMFNRAYAEIMNDAPVAIGDSVEEVIRRRAIAGEFGPGDPDQIIRRQMGHDLSKPQIRRRKRPNGTAIDVRTAPLPDGGHISVVTDITLLTQAEDEVAKRAAETNTMLASIRHGIVLMGPDRRVVFSNPIATELLGHPPGLLVPGRQQAEIIDHMLARGEFLSEPDPLRYAQDRLTMDRSRPHWARRRTAQGRVLEVRSDPAPDGGFVMTYTDVTETVAAEAELRRAKAAAEASNQAKSRFLATMSHELRTPLNAVIGFSESLLRESGGTPDPDRVGEFAQEINDAGRQLLSLINNILDVSRIDAGRFDLCADRVDLTRLLTACVRQFDQAARAAEVTLSMQAPGGNPEIRVDERRLQQVIANLLSNAIKFTGAGGQVTLTASRDRNDALVVQVKDTGIGIAPGDLDRVFEPFTQLDGTLTRRFQGAGLGLYVSRALVEAQGGTLTLSSEPGFGTVAEIRLPQPSPRSAVGNGPQESP